MVTPEESPLSPLQKRWVVNRVKEGENIWWLLKNPPLSPLQERWVVNRVKEGENIWWLLKNSPLSPSGEMGAGQG